MAIKIYEKHKLHDPKKKKNVEREIQLLSKIKHPNIIEMLATFETSRNVLYNYLTY